MEIPEATNQVHQHVFEGIAIQCSCGLMLSQWVEGLQDEIMLLRERYDFLCERYGMLHERLLDIVKNVLNIGEFLKRVPISPDPPKQNFAAAEGRTSPDM